MPETEYEVCDITKVTVTTTEQTFQNAGVTINSRARSISLHNLGSPQIHLTVNGDTPDADDFTLLANAANVFDCTANVARKIKFSVSSGTSPMNVHQAGS